MTYDNFGELESPYPVFSYNATKLSPKEVADTFVPSPAFQKLRDARNAILVGPRGSGKTTLLKMLTPDALSAWKGKEAGLARQRVQEVGVFIGTDAMWSEQLQVGDREQGQAFGAAAYALHIARSLVSTLLFRLGRESSHAADDGRHLKLTITAASEAQIAQRVASLFKLGESSVSLRRLQYDIGDRLNELGTYRYRTLDGQALPDWAYLNPLQAVSEIAEMTNQIANEGDRKWALLFDELELAPEGIVRDILRRLRGHEPTLVFKLSLAPILRTTDLLVGEHGAVHGQDVEFIPLTTPERSDAFVGELFESQRPSSSALENKSPEQLLGESYFDSAAASTGTPTSPAPYSKGGRVWQAMDRLQKLDDTFADYLKNNKIDLATIDRLSPSQRAAKIRKIRNIAIVRSHFLNGARRDTQGTRSLYTGETTLMAIPDGNPRMATILVRELVRMIESSGSIPLNRDDQAIAIEVTTSRFMALLHAQTGIRDGTRAVTLVKLLDAIGEALHHRLVRQRFSSDVAAGFFVDRSVPEKYLALLKQAVNTGAIVHIPRENSTTPIAPNARGRHYRLSYLLAPRYGLPVRQGKTVALSHLLQDALVKPHPQADDQTLLDLGDF